MASPRADEKSRGFQDRRAVDENVPERLRGMLCWKRTIRDFTQGDPKLADIISLFTQKFVQMGQIRNFTLSTLQDLAWAIVAMTWEAVLEGKFPLLDDIETGYRAKYEELLEQMNKLRMEFLAEIVQHRNERRERILSPQMQAVIAQVGGLEDNDVYRFIPEDFLNRETIEYFKAAVEENVKIALTKGTSVAGNAIKEMTEQLKEKDDEISDLKRQLSGLKELMSLNEAAASQKEPREKFQRLQSKHAGNEKDDEALKALQAALENAQQQLQETQQQNSKMREMMIALGLDPDDVDSAERQAAQLKREASLPKLNISPEEVDALRSKEREMADKCQELEKRIQALQEEIKSLQAKASAPPSVAPAKAEGSRPVGDPEEVKKLKAEVEKLRGEKKVLEQKLEELKQGASSNAELAAEMAKLKTALQAAQDRAKKAEDALQKVSSAPAHPKAPAAAPPVAAGNHELEESLREALQKEQEKQEKLKKFMEELKTKLKEATDSEQGVKKELADAHAHRVAIQKAFDDLREKFVELKKKLEEMGVDTAIFDRALEESGLAASMSSVFTRLYDDALRRQRREARERRKSKSNSGASRRGHERPRIARQASQGASLNGHESLSEEESEEEFTHAGSSHQGGEGSLVVKAAKLWAPGASPRTQRPATAGAIPGPIRSSLALSPDQSPLGHSPMAGPAAAEQTAARRRLTSATCVSSEVEAGAISCPFCGRAFAVSAALGNMGRQFMQDPVAVMSKGPGFPPFAAHGPYMEHVMSSGLVLDVVGHKGVGSPIQKPYAIVSQVEGSVPRARSRSSSREGRRGESPHDVAQAWRPPKSPTGRAHQDFGVLSQVEHDAAPRSSSGPPRDRSPLPPPQRSDRPGSKSPQPGAQLSSCIVQGEAAPQPRRVSIVESLPPPPTPPLHARQRPSTKVSTPPLVVTSMSTVASAPVLGPMKQGPRSSARGRPGARHDISFTPGATQLPALIPSLQLLPPAPALQRAAPSAELALLKEIKEAAAKHKGLRKYPEEHPERCFFLVKSSAQPES